MKHCEQQLGPESPNTQQSRTYLANVLAKLGKKVGQHHDASQGLLSKLSQRKAVQVFALRIKQTQTHDRAADPLFLESLTGRC